MTAVITGVGVVSAYGAGWSSFSEGLSAGRVAVGPIPWAPEGFPVKVAGSVPLVVRTRDRKLDFLLHATAEAWDAAGCGEDERRASMSVGLGLEQAFLDDFGPLVKGGGLDWTRAPQGPEAAFRSRLDVPAEIVRERWRLTGAQLVDTSACAAGALAVARAASWIHRGEAQIVLCGAADSMVNPLGLAGMWRLGAPSPRGTPDACRPFDTYRDGMVIGEGAAMFVLEDEARAKARGARILARLTGWGSSLDGYAPTAPRPDGAMAVRAMRRAVERSGRPREAFTYVNAHGTGTPPNDLAEARALHELFGSGVDRVAVSSIKGAIGHGMAAAGALELAACIWTLLEQRLPGTANLRTIDPQCALDVVGALPRPAVVEALLTNSFGFGGQNACLAVERGEA